MGIRAESSGLELSEMKARVKRIDLLERLANAAREHGAEEFKGEVWFSPSGSRKWKRRSDLSTGKAGGSIGDSVARKSHPEHIERVRGGVLEVGTRHPAAKYFRGLDAGLTPRPGRIKPKKLVRNAGDYPEKAPQRFSVWHLFRIKYRVFLRRETLEGGIETVPRPFLTTGPKMEERVDRALERWSEDVF